MAGTADIGLVGLGVMGRSLALNMARHGFRLAALDADPSRAAALAAEPGGRIEAADDPAALAAHLARPRAVLLMVPAGPPVDAVIDELAPLLAPGDIIADGGNSHAADTARRAQGLADRGLAMLGIGISGGEAGALAGPSIMAGGPPEAWERVRPLMEAIAAHVDGAPCAARVGNGAAGHFVKTVHNGIEYADMALIAEAADLMRRHLGLTPAAMAEVFARWKAGPLASFLIETAAAVLATTDPQSGRPLIDLVVDAAGQKGTGRWATEAALELGVAAPTIAEAVFSRALSADRDLRRAVAAAMPEPARQPPADQPGFLAGLEAALLAARITAYAQGFALMAAADEAHGWGIDLAAVARIWRGGCIIRARVLEPIAAAFAAGRPASLILDPWFTETLGRTDGALRRTCAMAAAAAVPLPVHASALAFLDALRSARLPADLIQGMRDAFGAHGFTRTDRPGTFHAAWGRGARG